MNDSSQKTLVKFYQVDNASLASLPIEAGHLIFVTDTNRLYLDKTDEDRIEIASYNLTQDQVDGHTLTFTNAEGTTTIITIPDNNTTYTGSDGITLTGTNFTNSGVRSVTQGSTNGTISVNTNGTTEEVAVKGLGTAAYANKGVANGIAELDANGLVPSSQLPGYVDDVIEGYYNTTDGKFYKESTYRLITLFYSNWESIP